MGNCCGGEEQTASQQQPSAKAFQGQGHRLGSANEVTPLAATNDIQSGKAESDLPPPTQDPNLSDGDRQAQRQERLAAAEARQKKMGGPPKKKREYKDTPLTGPNTTPAMRWTAG